MNNENLQISPNLTSHQKTFAMFFIRLGLAFVFTYAAISMSLNPQDYIHYFPQFIRSILPTDILFHTLAVFEILLSLWLLSGKWSLLSSSIGALLIYAITISNLDSFNILFRNVSIFCSAVSLAILSIPNHKQ